jgi:hypothetical protein
LIEIPIQDNLGAIPASNNQKFQFYHNHMELRTRLKHPPDYA